MHGVMASMAAVRSRTSLQRRRRQRSAAQNLQSAGHGRSAAVLRPLRSGHAGDVQRSDSGLSAATVVRFLHRGESGEMHGRCAGLADELAAV